MRSANEISGLVLKAARGAGMPLGCAEELARAAPHLAKAGELEMLRDLLSAHCAAPEMVGDVLVGGHPVMVMASVLDMEAAGRSVSADRDIPAALQAAMRAEQKVIGPFKLDQELRSFLEDLAAKTFVPETEASRLAGAGAGLTDND